ncbi:MAG: CPBP family intramembrane metalloprotease [Oscillospiraceae bacterium]|nr:CPBP family intramembrane metalloprotease [Oscillospiraceae bacterium]
MHKQLPIQLNISETRWGIRYLLFQLVFLATILSYALYYLFPGYNSAHLNFSYFSVNFAAVCWIFRDYLQASAGDFSNRWRKSLMAASLGFLVYYLSIFAVSAITYRLFPSYVNTNDVVINHAGRQNFYLMAVGTVLLAPVAEELFYRALVFGTLHRRSRILAYAVSTLVFAAIHVHGLDPVSFVQYLPAGLVLAWAYEFSGSIAAPLAIHIAVNTIGTLSMR